MTTGAALDSPRQIREALLQEEVGDFDRQYRAALTTAAGTFDLSPWTTSSTAGG